MAVIQFGKTPLEGGDVKFVVQYKERPAAKRYKHAGTLFLPAGPAALFEQIHELGIAEIVKNVPKAKAKSRKNMKPE